MNAFLGSFVLRGGCNEDKKDTVLIEKKFSSALLFTDNSLNSSGKFI